MQFSITSVMFSCLHQKKTSRLQGQLSRRGRNLVLLFYLARSRALAAADQALAGHAALRTAAEAE
jgi:hypothetical protein